MNNRKNNNSALFIATLGVYLGLVLAGATPQVLASAAMTRSFDVKDEIDFKDSLDKKPDDENKRASDAVQGYLQDVEYFLVNLQRLRSKGNFDVNSFARKYFNGGGHFNAAGGFNKEPLDEVVQKFKIAIAENATQLSSN